MMQQIDYQNIKFFDVTLRDGGYRNGFHFDDAVAKKLVKDLAEANINYIEIGYRNGLANPTIPVGLTGLCDFDYIYKLKSHAPQANIGVMLHPANVSYKDLNELKELGVSIIRVCQTAPTMEQNIDVINACRGMGFVTTANIVKISRMEIQAVLEKVEQLDDSQADVIYIADSFGHLIPEDVVVYMQRMKSITSKQLGFHAHNNLSLGLSNTISAMQHGATFIDASICGMGFGTGNLPMEILAGYLARIGFKNRLDLFKIFEIADYFSKNVINSHKALHPLDISWGLNNFSSHYRNPIEALAAEKGWSPYEIAELVTENYLTAPAPNKEQIREFVQHKFFKNPLTAANSTSRQ